MTFCVVLKNADMSKIIYWILCAGILFSACRKYEEEVVEAAAMELVVESHTPPDLSSPASPTEKSKKLIKTADVVFPTSDIALTYEQMNALIKKHKGYISEEREYKSEYEINKSLQVQIPAEHFDAFIDELSKNVRNFDNKNINIADVTDTYTDTEARINSRKSLEQRYLEILKQAKTVEEIINIEKELEDIRYEIESSQSRLDNMSKSIKYSGIQIRFYEKLNSQNELLYKVKNAFQDGWSSFLSCIVFVIKLWPFALVIGVLIFWWRKRRNRL